VVVVGVVWALLVPPWQTPDEVAHYAYAQDLAENFRLPPPQPIGTAGAHQLSTDQVVADNAVGASRGAFYPQSTPPEWDPAVWKAYQAQERSRAAPSRSDGGGPNPAGTYPPLYYLYADIGYVLDFGGTAYGHLYTMRLWGVLMVALNALAGWLLAGEVLGRRRLPQLACGAVAGLLPMETFMGASVNPDSLMVPLWTFALWLGARVIIRAAPMRDAIALCAVAAAAVLTTYTSYALLPAVALALFAGWRGRPREQRRSALRQVAVSSLALFVPLFVWFVLARALRRGAINPVAPVTTHTSPFNVAQFLSYIWQFYLPRVPGMTRFRWTGGLPAYDVWLKEGTAVFGWLTVWLSSWIYKVVAIIVGTVGLASVWFVAKLRGRNAVWLVGFFALAAIALIGGLNFTEYGSIINGQGHILQGRYLLPVIGLLGLAFALVISRVPARFRPSACMAVLVLLLSLQVLSMSAVVKAFYL
jgi:4-amino-4-deoxy-L-arabinose transferase-like glycosyltransferase